MSGRLDGRCAVVTGGAQGIGHAIATRLKADGATVTLWDMDAALLDEAVAGFGDGVQGAVVDVTDPEMVADAAAALTADGGQIDILVNNAGIAGPNAPLWDYPIDEWRRVLDIDLNGVFHCCRAVAPVMRAQNYGRIVNIASIAGKEGNPNASAYSAAKAGVIALTKSMGKELATSGVLINCIAPAALDTEMARNADPALVKIMIDKSPMQRLGTAEECAALVCWLASGEMRFSTGACFDLSGGRAVY